MQTPTHLLRNQLKERLSSYSSEQLETFLSLFPEKQGVKLKLLPTFFVKTEGKKITYDCLTGNFLEDNFTLSPAFGGDQRSSVPDNIISISENSLLVCNSNLDSSEIISYDLKEGKCNSIITSKGKLRIASYNIGKSYLISQDISQSQETKFHRLYLSRDPKNPNLIIFKKAIQIKFFASNQIRCIECGKTDLCTCPATILNLKDFVQLNKNCIITLCQEKIRYWWKRSNKKEEYDLVYHDLGTVNICVLEYGKNSKLIADTHEVEFNEFRPESYDAKIKMVSEDKFSLLDSDKYTTSSNNSIISRICLNSQRPTILEFGFRGNNYISTIYDKDSVGNFFLLQEIYDISEVTPLTPSEFVCLESRWDTIQIYSRELDNEGEYQVMKVIKYKMTSPSKFKLFVGKISSSEVEKVNSLISRWSQLPKDLVVMSVEFLI